MKVIFLLPGYTFTWGFVKAWTETLVWGMGRHDFSMRFETGSDIYYVREKLSEMAVLGDFDRMMWIDSDIMWTKQDIEKILSHDLDVVGGMYALSGPIDWPPKVKIAAMRKVMMGDVGVFQMLNGLSLPTDGPGDLIKVDGLGFGFLCVKPQVFRDVGVPHFKPRVIGLPDGRVGNSSEDIGFCAAAQEAGYDIWLDTSIRLKHQKVQDLST